VNEKYVWLLVGLVIGALAGHYISLREEWPFPHNRIFMDAKKIIVIALLAIGASPPGMFLRGYSDQKAGTSHDLNTLHGLALLAGVAWLLFTANLVPYTAPRATCYNSGALMGVKFRNLKQKSHLTFMAKTTTLRESRNPNANFGRLIDFLPEWSGLRRTVPAARHFDCDRRFSPRSCLIAAPVNLPANHR